MKRLEYKRKNGVDVIEIYFNEISKYHRLNDEEEKELVEKAKKDEKIKEKLLNHNLWVVSAVANKFLGCKINFIDLISIGNLGLLKAINNIENYNYQSRFSTYVYSCAKSKILDSLRKEKRHRYVTNNNWSQLEEIVESEREKQVDILEKEELLKCINYSIKEPQTKDIFKKYFEEEKSMKKVAKELDISAATIHNKIKKELKNLRIKFAEAS